MHSARPTLVLLHGFPLDSALWDGQRADLGRVAHVLAPDLRGFGGDARDVPEVVSMERHAADVRDLLDAHGSRRAVLCGLSMGGYIALAFAEQWPERLSGLVLAFTRATADDTAGKEARRAMAQDASGKGMDVIARAMLPKLLHRNDARSRDSMEAMIARQRPQGVAASALGMAQRPDRTAVLRSLRVPVLVIAGKEDALMPMDTAEAMAHAAPQGHLHVLSGAGHLGNVDSPAEFNAALKDFLAATKA